MAQDEFLVNPGPATPKCDWLERISECQKSWSASFGSFFEVCVSEESFSRSRATISLEPYFELNMHFEVNQELLEPRFAAETLVCSAADSFSDDMDERGLEAEVLLIGSDRHRWDGLADCEKPLG